MKSEDLLGIDCTNAPCISAKTGLNVDQVLEAILIGPTTEWEYEMHVASISV